MGWDDSGAWRVTEGWANRAWASMGRAGPGLRGFDRERTGRSAA